MADCFSVQSAMMRDKTNFIIENGNVDNFDTASQGSRDDCVELDPRFMEDRFRVDRKKLEQMLQMVPGDEFVEGAEDFFQRVMDETNTQITWPSKLKIGAKSKKDPHIKVIGFPDDVRAAKAKIMSILDTKSNRVTLKMDVSHTEHSHVIGKGGNNIKRVMMETGCHIHFPDSNRGSNVQEKSNQVSIAGQPAGVENARAQIRELLPLVFMFELPTTPAVLQAAQDPSQSVVVQQLQQLYNVTVSFKQRPRVPLTTVLVRGSVINAKSVKEATGKLMEAFTGVANLVVSMHLEIAPQHHLFIIGRQGSNVKSIMQSTNASILFPDPSTSGPQRKGTVVIRGSIESVFCARQHLIGCLPLVLMFDVKEEIELEQGRLTQLMEQLDVFISVKPKPKQPSKSVIVKSIERNARNMYLARLLLLGLHPEGLSDSLLKAASSNGAHGAGSTGLGLTSLGFLNSHSLLNVSTAAPSSLVLMNGHSNPQSPSLGSPLSATPAISPSHWLHSNPGLFSPLMVVAPASSVPASFDVLSQCNGFHKDFAPQSPFIRMPTQQSTSSNNSDSASPPAQSPRDSPRSGIGFRHGAAVELGSLPTEDSMENVITRDPSTLSSSGHTLDLLGLSKTTPPLSQPPPPVTATLFNGMARMQNGDKSPESSGAESDGSEKLAPGIERKNSSSTLFTPLPFPFDYEQKKLLAMKAMQKHPEGESRIPTDIWSGMGFSKSMPESAIRDRLGQLGISHARFDDQSPLQTPAEFAQAPPDPPHPESDSDIDRDPWKDSKTTTDPYLNKAPGEYPSLRKKHDYGMKPPSMAQQHQQGQGGSSGQQLMGSSGGSGGGKVDLAELFSKLGLGKYTDLFQQQEIDLGTFLTMTDQDLKELGITTFGARRKMLLAIADLNKGHTLLQQAQPRALNNPFSTNGAMSSSRRPDLASLSGVW